MDDWQFYQHADESWSWRNVRDDAERESSARFTNFTEAMADAMQNGFQVGVSTIASISVDHRS